MMPRGGKRPGAGRPKSKNPARNYVPVKLTDDELKIVDGLRLGTDGRGTVIRRLIRDYGSTSDHRGS
jgi:hypothetical protein